MIAQQNGWEEVRGVIEIRVHTSSFEGVDIRGLKKNLALILSTSLDQIRIVQMAEAKEPSDEPDYMGPPPVIPICIVDVVGTVPRDRQGAIETTLRAYLQDLLGGRLDTINFL